MDKSLYVVMSGARASLQSQAVVANNLANANTSGFKQALTHTNMFPVQGPGYPARQDAVLVDSGFDRSPGSRQHTGNALDIALQPGCWLAVQSSNGSTAYTRNGALSLNSHGQLMTAEGHALLDDQDNPLALPAFESIRIAQDGMVSIIAEGDSSKTPIEVGRLSIINAEDNQLQRGADGLMRGISAQDTFLPAAGQVLDSGVLEGSNVNSATALVQMIQQQRQFEMQVKLIQHGDENARSANSLLRLNS